MKVKTGLRSWFTVRRLGSKSVLPAEPSQGTFVPSPHGLLLSGFLGLFRFLIFLFCFLFCLACVNS